MKVKKEKSEKMSKTKMWKNLVESGSCKNRKEARKIIKKGRKVWNVSSKFSNSKSSENKPVKSNHLKPKTQNKVENKMNNSKFKSAPKKISSVPKNEVGISFSNSATADRMRQLQAFVDSNSKSSGNSSVRKVQPDRNKPQHQKGKLIKDTQKLERLMKEKKDDEREIKKIDKLLTKSKRKFKIHGFDEDFGSLLDDIDEGTMHNSEDYSEAPIVQEENNDEVNNLLKNLVNEELEEKSHREITTTKKRRTDLTDVSMSKKLKLDAISSLDKCIPKKSCLTKKNEQTAERKQNRISFSNKLDVKEYTPSNSEYSIHEYEDQNLELDEEVLDDESLIDEEMDMQLLDDSNDEMEIEEDSMLDEEIGEDFSADEQESDVECMSGAEDDNSNNGLTEEETDFVENGHGSGSELDETEENDSKASSDLEEDMYGRLKDKHGNIVDEDAYVPPAMRNKTTSLSDAKSQELSDLKRKITSLFTKLTEHNMASILKDLEILYSKFSRNDLNEIIFDVTSEIVVRPTLPTETCMQDFAFLISTLSANCGSEIGSHILTEFVSSFLSKMDELQEDSNEDSDSKELDCLLSFISQLFNFKVVASDLIYDILMKLSDKLGLKQVDLILLVLRSVGFTLRKMNPVALKTLILQIQEKVSLFTEEDRQANSRLSFMLECLKAIKNNNTTKLPDYNTDHVEKLRSMSKTLVRRGCLHPEINVTLNDIVKSKDIGRWWLVGSAWKGDGDQNEEIVSMNEPQKPEITDPQMKAFLERAEKLKLSRPPLVNIFYILTEGSIDATDAAQKLVDLKLDKTKLPQIFNVLVFCVQRANFYDNFYKEVATQLVFREKKNKWLLKKSIWAKFGDLENAKSKHLSHLAQFLGHLIAHRVLDITIFKLLRLDAPTAKLVKFFRPCILTIIFSSTGEKNVIDIVLPLWSEKSTTLRKRLLLFIKVSIVPTIAKEHQKKLALFMHILTKEPDQNVAD